MLSTLNNIIQEVVAAADLETALDIIVRRVAEAMEVTYCTIHLLDPKKKHYVLRAAKGLEASAIGEISATPEAGLIGLVGSRAEPVNLEDAELHPRFQGSPKLSAERYHAFLGVPVIHHRRLLGVLSVSRKEKRRFNETEEAFSVTLSTQIAAVIAHTEAVSGKNISGQRGAQRTDAIFKGTSGAPGVAIGQAVIMYPRANLNAVPDRTITDIDAEHRTCRKAIEAVKTEIHALQTKLVDHLQSEHSALFDLYLQMLADNALAGEIREYIDQGYWAQSALKYVIAKHTTRFAAMQDVYLRERGDDVRQLGQHILANLQQTGQRRLDFPDKAILIAEDLTLTMLGEIPRAQLAGMISMSGSANSHIAILSRALNVPTVMGVVDLPYLGLEGHTLIVDSFYGNVHINPSAALRTRYEVIIESEQDFANDLLEKQNLPCETPDHHRVHLWVNINLPADIDHALNWCAEGIGLYRTEFPFMDKEHFPTEEEQRTLYREHMKKFAPRDITMRTLDIGGDKLLPYFPIVEDNPFLGWRGIRVTLDHPEILTVQVRAMLKAHAGLKGRLRIMLPMITHVEETEEAKRLILRCHEEVIAEGYADTAPLIGVMIEVPAAVYQAEVYAHQMDFLAVGSNDLTQYILAVDRNNSQVAELYNELHPAMLRALLDIANAAHKANTAVSICGELAANPSGSILLMAMGYETLSMNAVNLPRIRWAIRNMPFKKARELLEQAMTMHSAAQITAFMEDALIKANLGRLLRPQETA